MSIEHIWSQEAEEEVLGSIINNKGALMKAQTILSTDDFYEPRNKLIFESAIALQEDGLPVDLILILEDLKKRNGNKQWALYLAQILDNRFGHIERLEHYAKIIKEKSIKRDLHKKAKILIQEKDNFEIEKQLNEMVKVSREIPEAHNLLNSISSISDQVVGEIEKRQKGERVENEYKTGFLKLDDILGGIIQGQLYVIAGRPSSGKTSIALNIAMHIAKTKIPILFLSFETIGKELTYRLLSSSLRMRNKKLRWGKLTEEEMEKVIQKQQDFQSLDLQVMDKTDARIEIIAKIIQRFSVEKENGVVFLDYLQLVRGKGDSREREVAEISRQLKVLTLNLNIPIIVLSQLNREVEKRGKNAKPKLSDLRESGAIEQDADVVIFLHRDSEKKYQEGDNELIEVFVAKQRNGATAKTRLLFHGEYTRFDNYVEDDVNF